MTEVSVGDERRRSISTPISARPTRRITSRRCTRRSSAAATFRIAHDHARRQAPAQRHRRGAGGRRRALHARRLLSRRRRAPGRQPHHDRSRDAALHEPRALQGHPRRHARAPCSTAASSCAQDAQKTDSKQTNRALLLSDDAQINSNPQLEIFADDVKCTHGAAIGQLDDEALFYLRARGLTPTRRARHADSRLCRRGARRHRASSTLKAAARCASCSCSSIEILADHEALAEPIAPTAAAQTRRRASTCRRCARISRSCRELVHGKPLVYLDSANTSQKPESCCARWTTTTPRQRQHPPRDAPAERARDARCTRARARRRRASSTRPTRKTIVLTTGTTDGINLVAQSYGRTTLKPGDEVLHLLARAPLEHRAVADCSASRPARCCASRRSTTRRDRSRRVRGAAVGAHADRRGRATSRTRSARSIRSRR